jgi:hypothetical protein
LIRGSRFRVGEFIVHVGEKKTVTITPRTRLALAGAASVLALSLTCGAAAWLGASPAWAANEHASDTGVAASANGNGGESTNVANAGPGNNNGNGGESTNVANAGPGNNNGNGNGPQGNAFGRNGDNTPNGNGGGNLNAEIAALHASNANLQAFIHANPKSEVGLIAIYAQAEVAVENAQAAVTTATTAFNASAALATFEAAYPNLAGGYSIQALEYDHDTLMAVSMPTAAQSQEIAALNTLLSSPEAIALIQDQATLATDQIVATNDLTNASNKPVDSSIQAYVDSTLEQDGILTYYRTH